LADVHADFHVFCKDHFLDGLLYPECCHEFHLLTKDSDVNKEYIVIENTLRYQEIDDSHYDNHCDAFNIVLNASFKDGCDEDLIIHFENLKNDEQMDISTGDNFRSTTNTKGSLEFLDLQIKVVCGRYEEEGEEKKGLDQKLSLYFPPTEIKQSTFSIEFCEGKEEQHYNQLDQQLKEIFHYDFNDPFANYLESMNSICVKVFLSLENWLDHLFKSLCCWLSIPLLFRSRSRTLTVNQFLIWLHWKFDFT
jgi:hypothetical protein